MVESTHTNREFEFTHAHFVKVKDELYDYAGIVLAEHKMDMAYNRLVRRLRELRLNSFEDYFRYLDQHPEEFTQFINALTTNLTAFFRERHHFEFITQRILPELAAKSQRSLRVWSAGCSLGEEPYSIAITLQDAMLTRGWDMKILATDIDSKVLASAQSGEYSFDRVKALPDATLRKWFLRGKGSRAGQVKVRQPLQDMITFRHLNLMHEWPMKTAFDIIFCRNVMIYFDQATQSRLLNRMASLLTPGGYLFVGHSESLARTTTEFALVGGTTYRKVQS
ncbi:protein-glutamate O-methyltransferase CheR [Neptuniibacter sp. CAU 1671]|uniref:CheR family methyltransferase n=1 Tax=Neptuniibacter sp. CAU 1671 TaxID=3032593 RepID=UPI0023DB6C66|nr:protein-glutamate O-methyltransferase CheR [Neptuniibacter sp. CAU 1671]MDF2182578.1 protein-glutamate O-methyltransferase CheR [Neptuniibacter sp. CAU 1671]